MTFWENCGEDDVKLPKGQGRMDPVLHLYKNCRVMLPCNNDVRNGQANGTQATLEKVVLKPGKQMKQVLLEKRIPITAVTASQIVYIIL